MPEDITNQIEKEVVDLQGKLKDRLKQQEDLGNLEKNLNQEVFTLEAHTQEYRETAGQANWRMWFKVFKWYVLIGIIVCLIIFIVYRLIRL